MAWSPRRGEARDRADELVYMQIGVHSASALVTIPWARVLS